MYERLPTSGLGGYARDNPFGLLAALSIVLLTVLVAFIGIAAIVARVVGTWQSLFYMEQAFAMALPTVKVLMGVSIVASIAYIMRN